MIKYSSYLMKNILSKWTIWIILLVTIVVSFVITYLQIRESTKFNVVFVTSVNTFTKMIPFIFGISYISLIIVYVFKEGEDDGTELLIVSKPISRTQIILGKFLVIFISIVFFTIVLFGAEFIFAQFDRNAIPEDRLRFAASLSIGGSIVIAIATVIIMLIASFLGKVGTIAIGIITAATIPVASTIVSEVSKGIPQSFASKALNLINQDEVNDLMDKKIDEYLDAIKKDPNILEDILKRKGVHNTNGQKITLKASDVLKLDMRDMYPFEKSNMDKYNEYVNARWYDKAAYGDLWYQWSTFYGLFDRKKNTYIAGETYKATVKKEIVHISDEDKFIKIDGKNIAIPVDIYTANTHTMENAVGNMIDAFVPKKTSILGKQIDKENSEFYNVHKRIKVQVLTEGDRNTYLDILAGTKDWNSIPKHELSDFFTKSQLVASDGQPHEVTFEDQIRAIKEIWGTNSGHKTSIAHLSVEEYLIYKGIVSVLEAKNDLMNKYWTMIEKSINDKSISDKIKQEIDSYTYVKPKKIYGFADPKVTKRSGLSAKEEEAYKLAEVSGMLVDGEEANILEKTRFIKRNLTLFAWAGIGGLLLLITILRYFRRDFK